MKIHGIKVMSKNKNRWLLDKDRYENTESIND